MKENIEKSNMSEEEKTLRKLLWVRHGCPIIALYGDDGEMQCNRCLIDFKRDSVEIIQKRFLTFI